ncbi:hypothetical protein, partial [uncultured Legionella sp.]|uniref:hypothetical protein n=1 Tax=uncultured Legionella sp. TaxID=210934 RepID=UPI0026331B2F
MPKPNDLNSLLQVQQEAAGSNSDYYLFPLGTDTLFTAKPTKNSSIVAEQKNYENGETLSYMAQLVANRLGEDEPEIQIDRPLSFSTPSVDVLNGPTTLGTEVGDRVAQGVFLILKAIAEGKKNIQIAAHSRGAVESILIAHELERIKAELTSSKNQTIFQILSESPCSYTRKGFKDLFGEINEQKIIRTLLAQRLSSAKINMFLIDPVPGGSWWGIGALFAWRDQRFYQSLPCTYAELALLRDERTRCFIPIVPSGLAPLIFPGHHGTASGNIYSQQFESVPEAIEYRDTALVQQLMLLKLMNFINKSTGLFDRNSKTVSLEHSVLDELTNEFLACDKPGKAEFLLTLYKHVHLNDKAYRHFSNTSYPILGTESSSSGARLVHAHGHNYTAMDSIAPSWGGKFINKEHAFLYLLKNMEFELENDDYQPDKLTSALGNGLVKLFKGYSNCHNTDPTDLLQSISHNSHALLDSDVERKATFDAISIFIDTISQKYLRNHLSVAVKTNLLAEIHRIFDLLQNLKNIEVEDAPINKIIDECEIIIRTSLKNTAQTHYSTLLDQANRIDQRLRYFLAPEEQFNEVFKDFITTLELFAAEENDCSHLIRRVINSLTSNQDNPISVKQIETVLYDELTHLNDNDTLSAKEAIAYIMKSLSSKSPSLEGFFDAEELDVPVLLSELDKLYENFDSFINGFEHVQQLAGNSPLSMSPYSLKMQRDRIIRCIAEILIKHQVDLSNKPQELSDGLFQVVKGKVIDLGGSNLEVANLFRDVNQLRNLIIDNTQNIKSINRVQEEYLLQLRELQQNHQNLMEQISRNKSAIESLTAQVIENAKTSNDEFEHLKKERLQLIHQLTESKSALEDLTQLLSDTKQENSTEIERLKQKHQLLIKQLTESKSAQEELTRQMIDAKQENSSELQRLKQEQELLTKQLREGQAAFETFLCQVAEAKKVSNTETQALKQEQERLTSQLTESKLALQELTRQLAEAKQENGNETQALKQEQERLTSQLTE